MKLPGGLVPLLAWFACGGTSLVAAQDETLAAPAVPEPAAERAALPDTEALRAVREQAVAFLLASQLPDGTWAGPVAADLARHRAWTTAATALAVQALLPAVRSAQPEERVREVFEAGLSALLVLCAERSASAHAVWGEAYALAACAAILAELERGLVIGVGREVLQTTARGLVARLSEARGPDGGWGVSEQLERESLLPDGSSRGPLARRLGQTHVTAVVVLALQAAYEQGVPGTHAALQSSRAALRRSRRPEGGFSHRLALLPGPGHRFGAEEIPASLGRTVLVTLALFESVPYGTTRAEVRAALDVFFLHHASLDVVLMSGESALSGQSAYVYLFSHAYAARALDALLPAERALYDRRLAREILVVQRADGAFLDHPLFGFGPAVGTAFALTVLEAALRE